jgi:hypothetical protein
MHTYTKRWNDDERDYDQPSYDDFHFRGLDDLIRWAELDRTTAWRTWPEIWHLDDDGAFRCGSKGSSFEGVHTYAKEPGRLLDCRWYMPRDDCPDRWLIIEARHPWDEPYRVDESDAAAFLELRHGLEEYAITLLDVVVFDQEFHCWSLHELTTGSTTWPS